MLGNAALKNPEFEVSCVPGYAFCNRVLVMTVT
jgi:hypothetical protein